MEAIGPSTCPGLGPFEPDAPDTVRDGTEPLAAPQRVATAPMGVTMPLARVASRAPRLTYEVYTPDDTLRGARALTAADAARATVRRDQRRRLGLGAIGLVVTLSTALMAIGSCDDSATGRVETTSAVTTVQPSAVAPPPTAIPSSPVAEVIPPITFSPPLTPPPRRRAPTRTPAKPPGR